MIKVIKEWCSLSLDESNTFRYGFNFPSTSSFSLFGFCDTCHRLGWEGQRYCTWANGDRLCRPNRQQSYKPSSRSHPLFLLSFWALWPSRAFVSFSVIVPGRETMGFNLLLSSATEGHNTLPDDFLRKFQLLPFYLNVKDVLHRKLLVLCPFRLTRLPLPL